jgi:hypothetical protein
MNALKMSLALAARRPKVFGGGIPALLVRVAVDYPEMGYRSQDHWP